MTIAASIAPASAERAPHRFFVAMSGLLLAIVVIGFAPSFYLRAHFAPLFPQMGAPTLPGYLYVHGAILTTWYTLLFVQATLIRARRVDLHKTVGVVGAVVAIGVLAASSVVLGNAAPRLVASGTPLQGVSAVIFGDIFTLICFATFVATAISLRRRSEAHKRLMLLASIVIVGPALSRGKFFPIYFGEPQAGDGYVALAQLGLLLALPAYDLVSRRRVHPASAWGVAGVVVGSLPVNVFIMSDRALAIVERFAQG